MTDFVNYEPNNPEDIGVDDITLKVDFLKNELSELKFISKDKGIKSIKTFFTNLRIIRISDSEIDLTTYSSIVKINLKKEEDSRYFSVNFFTLYSPVFSMRFSDLINAQKVINFVSKKVFTDRK